MIEMPGTSFRGKLPEADEALKMLSAELHRDIEKLAVEIGERNVRDRPRELARAADYIAAELKTAGCRVERQEYEVPDGKCCNLAGEIRGKTRPEEIVIVGAHYDTVYGSPGANDNTTGIAGMLTLARRFGALAAKGQPPARTLRFLAFVHEEPPYFQTEKMGSLVYARACKARGEKIVAMLSLETIGWYDDASGSQKYPKPLDRLYPSTGNFIGFVGNTTSRDLVHRVIATFRKSEPFPSEGAALPEAIPGVGFSDHWSFWQAGYPALMVTDTAMYRYPHYHEAADTIEKVDFERTARVVRGLAKVVDDLVTEE
jgi:Zn-dependent M28 family amino/carboxypeptidase